MSIYSKFYGYDIRNGNGKTVAKIVNVGRKVKVTYLTFPTKEVVNAVREVTAA